MRRRIERHIEQRTLLLSGVSHDLRTPLTRMRLALSLMEDEPEARALIGDVAEMEALIDRFLEFTRTEVGEPAVPVDLGALVAQRVGEAARGGRDVTLIGATTGPVITLRPQLLARALDNLINNALRYGTRARVGLAVEGGHPVISVEDDGPGIEPAQYDRATRPFVRLDPARGASLGSGCGAGPGDRRRCDAQPWRAAGPRPRRDARLRRVAREDGPAATARRIGDARQPVTSWS